jgi:hypothetical protein
MKGYFSHLSAAKAWQIPYIEDVLGNEITDNTLDDITVFEQDQRFAINGKKVHSCKLDLPTGAVTVRNGMTVASPELLFLELAGRLSIHRLILLGLQLCSHPQGQPSNAITTKQKLGVFLAKTAGHRGHRKAERALKYVENGSASIMESVVYMILVLPHALGGYGLEGAVLNHEIKLFGESRKLLGQNRCFADLYYKEEKLDVEYESFAYHSSPSEQSKDIIRADALERQGISVMHLCTKQMYDSKACKSFAYNLASRLGKRINIRTNKFEEMHALLRALLPNQKLSVQK